MPNWVENYLSFQGEEKEIKKMLEFIKDDDTVLSFEKIVPIQVFEREWFKENWGTVKVSFHSELINNQIIFETAWSCCDKVILRLGELFPKLDFEYKYIETIGVNVGSMSIKKGECIDENHLDDYSREAYELSFQIYPDMQMSYRLDEDDNYEEIEDDEELSDY